MLSIHRKRLNHQQLFILTLIARYRFISVPHLHAYIPSMSLRYTQTRLRILSEQKYIGKRYDISYRLAGRPAEYYLLPNAISMLKEQKQITPALAKLLSKDSNASDRFVRHCLSILSSASQLTKRFGETLQFRTRSDYASNELFPQPLPDGYAFITHEDTNERTHFFIEVFDGTMPETVMRTTIKKHIIWYDDGDWAITAPYPTVILICRDGRLKNKVDRWLEQGADDDWPDDVNFEVEIRAV